MRSHTCDGVSCDWKWSGEDMFLVEVYLEGQWGTVCWRDGEVAEETPHPKIYTAQVVCRQAGYGSALDATTMMTDYLSAQHTYSSPINIYSSPINSRAQTVPINMYAGSGNGTVRDGWDPNPPRHAIQRDDMFQHAT